MAPTRKISPAVLAQAEKLGIYGTWAEARILQMARLAARISHPDATHRFRQYIMTIAEDGTVTMLDKMDAAEDVYYSRRKYEDRKVDESGGDPDPEGEAIVTPKRGS
jgi:hypothetical protein